MQDRGMDSLARRFRRAVELTPELVEAKVELGQAAFRAGDWKGAAEQLSAALAWRPQDPEIHMWLARCWASQQRWQLSITEFRAAARLKPDWADAHYELGRALRAIGDAEGASRYFQTAQRLNSTLRPPP